MNFLSQKSNLKENHLVFVVVANNTVILSGLVKFFIRSQRRTKPYQWFENMMTFPALDRVSFWTDKIISHITPSFHQHLLEVMGWAHFPRNKWTLKSCSTKIFFWFLHLLPRRDDSVCQTNLGGGESASTGTQKALQNLN